MRYTVEIQKVQILDRIDKKETALGSQTIIRELECKLPGVLESGGFASFIDYAVPPEILWGDFRYCHLKTPNCAGGNHRTLNISIAEFGGSLIWPNRE